MKLSKKKVLIAAPLSLLSLRMFCSSLCVVVGPVA